MTSIDPLTRRGAVTLAGMATFGTVALASCSSDSQATSTAASPAISDGSGQSGTNAATDAIATTDIPVGGGTIYADLDTVVTQPTSGEFKAFSATCTHQGCKVTRIESGVIMCPCHNSEFDITTGAVTSGPAKQALATKTVTVSGDSLTVA